MATAASGLAGGLIGLSYASPLYSSKCDGVSSENAIIIGAGGGGSGGPVRLTNTGSVECFHSPLRSNGCSATWTLSREEEEEEEEELDADKLEVVVVVVVVVADDDDVDEVSWSSSCSSRWRVSIGEAGSKRSLSMRAASCSCSGAYSSLLCLRLRRDLEESLSLAPMPSALFLCAVRVASSSLSLPLLPSFGSPLRPLSVLPASGLVAVGVGATEESSMRARATSAAAPCSSPSCATATWPNVSRSPFSIPNQQKGTEGENQAYELLSVGHEREM